MFCTQCGKQIPDDSKFCTGCGAKISAPKSAGVPDAAGQSKAAPHMTQAGGVVQQNSVQRNKVQQNAARQNTVQQSDARKYAASQYSTDQYETNQYTTNPYSTDQDSAYQYASNQYATDRDELQQPDVPKKRKKGGALKAVLILVIFLAVIGISFLAAMFFLGDGEGGLFAWFGNNEQSESTDDRRKTSDEDSDDDAGEATGASDERGSFSSSSSSAASSDNSSLASSDSSSDEDGSQENSLSSATVGSYITFGTFEQDNDTSNGKEDIEWLVLDIQDGRALAISKYALDCRPYYTTYTDVTWEGSSIKTWLNGEFLSNAFTTAEQNKILLSYIVTPDNEDYDSDGGNDTWDKVFLLSIDEAKNYFTSISGKCAPTAYAKAKGAWTMDPSDKDYNAYLTQDSEASCYWWLRSPGDENNNAAIFFINGNVDSVGNDVNDATTCVRPAMWLDLSS